MSWGEVKKINSDLNVPLNHLIWLQDYKTFGEDGYVYRDKRILEELYRSPIASNDNHIYLEALDYFVNNDEAYIGKWLSNIYEFRNLDGLSNCKSLEQVISNDEYIDAISTSYLSNDFFSINKVAGYYASTQGLKRASQNNNIMTALESNASFKSAVLQNTDIQTIESAPVLNGDPIIVNNAYVISFCASFWMRWSNGWVKTRGKVSKIPHGSTDEVVISSRVEGTNVDVLSMNVNAFLKNLTINQPDAGDESHSVKHMVKYIPLDSVV